MQLIHESKKILSDNLPLSHLALPLSLISRRMERVLGKCTKKNSWVSYRIVELCNQHRFYFHRTYGKGSIIEFPDYCSMCGFPVESHVKAPGQENFSHWYKCPNCEYIKTYRVISLDKCPRLSYGSWVPHSPYNQGLV